MANSNPPNQFVKGKSGNPNGRPPKGHSITETIREMMDEKPEIKRALGAKILEMAMKGDITAMKTIWNYMDGMPIQKNETELSGPAGNPIAIIGYSDHDSAQLRSEKSKRSSPSGLATSGEISSPQLAPQSSQDNGRDQQTD